MSLFFSHKNIKAMALPTNMATNTLNLNFRCKQTNTTKRYCLPVQQQQLQVEAGIICESCNGRGWLLCEFCKGQKTNVKGDNNRIYRRCPSCKAVGSILCSRCKVFKCVTFPDENDGEQLSF